MALSTLLKNRSTGEAGELINSSDIPDGTKTVTIVVAAIRESPEGFNAPAIIACGERTRGALRVESGRATLAC